MSGYRCFKLVILALLACNAALFIRSGSLNEALDSAAWFTLLVLFELEAGAGPRLRRAPSPTVIRGIRLLAALAILVAAVGYAYDGERLEAVNAWLWIAVVALLEFEVRWPSKVAAHAAAFALTAAVLYASLAAVAAAWAWQGEWFDAYDALLWLIAFASLELDVLGRLRRPALMRRSTERAAELGDEA